MADQSQHAGTNDAVKLKSLTGLDLSSDSTNSGNAEEKSTALAEVDPDSVSVANSNALSNTKPNSATDSKQVSIVEPNAEASGVNEDLEVALQAGEDNQDELDDGAGGANMQMGAGEKKKKNKKRRPKSQRGLVPGHSSVRENPC